MNEKYWFPAKRYGWGWGPPSTWQGWLVVVVWLAAFVAVCRFLPPVSPLLLGAALLVVSIPLALVLRWKGEPTQWRWGKSSTCE